MRKKVIFEFSSKRVEICLGTETIERKVAYGNSNDEEVSNAITAKITSNHTGNFVEDTAYYEDEVMAQAAFAKVVGLLALNENLNIWDELMNCEGFVA